MLKVRQDLIEKELSNDVKNGFEFHYQKLSNKFLDWLFRHYYTDEFYENFYDSEIDDEEERLILNNWQDLYCKGSWGMSQKNLDIYSKSTLKMIKKLPKSIKNRLYFAKKDNKIVIYFYGRDYWLSDYWFILKKRNKRLL